MKKIGITGGIGSGKTFVANIFKTLLLKPFFIYFTKLSFNFKLNLANNLCNLINVNIFNLNYIQIKPNTLNLYNLNYFDLSYYF